MSQKASPPETGRAIDWRAVEADYLAGLAVRAIARRHGASPSTVYRRARKRGWRRPPEGARAEPDARAPERRPPANNELSRLRALAAKLGERLERVIDGEAPDDVVLGARESPAALLLKLCQISEKIIAIERRLAGAEAPTPTQLNEQDRDILNRFKHRYRVR